MSQDNDQLGSRLSRCDYCNPTFWGWPAVN